MSSKNKTFKSLSVIIPNYNGEELLPFFLPFLYAALNNYPGKYEVIIVDDKSTDNSKKILEKISEEYSNIKIIFNQSNSGFSRTCNVGIKASQYEVLFFFNNDVKIGEDYFNYFSKFFEDENTFAVSTCGLFYNSGQPLDGIKRAYWRRGLPRIAYDVHNDQIMRSKVNPPYQSFAVQGAYFFADRKKVLQLGGFDELFSPYNYEETDLSYRALKRGWKIYYEPKCVGYHKVNTSINKLSSSSHKRMIFNRNRLIFVWKNISYKPYLFSNIFYVFFKLLTLNIRYYKAVRHLIHLWPDIMQKRKEEKLNEVVRDEDLFRNFQKYQKGFLKQSDLKSAG